MAQERRLSYPNSLALDFAKIYKEKVGEDYRGSTAVDSGSGGDSSGTCQCSASAGSGVSGLEVEKLKQLAKDNGGSTAISVLSADGKTKGDSDGDTQKATRSTYKLYTAYATLRAIEAGKINWNSKQQQALIVATA
jgi:beta-lactamase class A